MHWLSHWGDFQMSETGSSSVTTEMTIQPTPGLGAGWCPPACWCGEADRRSRGGEGPLFGPIIHSSPPLLVVSLSIEPFLLNFFIGWALYCCMVWVVMGKGIWRFTTLDADTTLFSLAPGGLWVYSSRVLQGNCFCYLPSANTYVVASSTY